MSSPVRISWCTGASLDCTSTVFCGARRRRWYSLSRVDGATVTTADGRGVVYRKRDRDLAAALFKESAAVHRELFRRFPEMRRRYRDAHADLVTKEAWGRVFES